MRKKNAKKVTRYTYGDIKEPRTPETGHTSLLPADEQVVTLPMDNGCSKAIEVGKLPEDDERPVVIDMDPAAAPVLFWAGKRDRREVRQSRIRFDPGGKTYLVRVVVDTGPAAATVVTVYRTSDIERYWRDT